jgi:Domain of unknown function (DUF5666)
MTSPSSGPDRSCRFCLSCSLSIIAIVLATAFASGCGGGPKGPTLRGNTTVVVLASSTANDQLVEFPIALKNLTLTSQSGNTVTLFSGPLSAEFIHLNGTVEPVATATIPQDTYASATATGATAPVCVGLQSPPSPGAIFIDGSVSGSGASSVTVNLPAPIEVRGTAMGLLLNLQVSQSAPFSGGCVQNLSVAISPVFDLTPVMITAQPTNSTNGKVLGLEGVIASTTQTGTGFTVTAPIGYWNDNPPTWQVSTNDATVFQGISGSSGLSTGMPVDMDVALQSDGSLMASRVAVYNTDAANLSLSIGQVILAGSSQSSVDGLTTQAVGNVPGMDDEFGYGNATSQISGQFTNLQNLPFVATFNAASTVAGQNVVITSNAPLVDGFPPLPLPLATMTLMPQTINGTVSAVSTSGGFTTYTVTLAPYDLFTELAGQPGQPALTSPNAVVVYADNNTQMLNSSSISVGSVFRFYGLVFNDNGTLSMDCAQVNDGVAE